MEKKTNRRLNAIFNKFCLAKIPTRIPLQREMDAVRRAVAIAQKYVQNANYAPTAEELAFVEQLTRELGDNYFAAQQIAAYMRHKLGRVDEVENQADSLPRDDDSWFLL